MNPVPDLTKGRTRNLWIWVTAGVFALVVVAGSWWFMKRGRRIESQRRVEEAWARFERCLIGPPLAPGESARLRVRHIWLATPTPPESLSARERERLWPHRCARYLDAAWFDANNSRYGAPVASLFMSASAEVRTTGEPGTYRNFDDLFADVAKTGIRMGADARVPFPDQPVKPFRKADLTSLGVGWVATWARREGSTWRFLLDGKSLCEIDLVSAAGGCTPLAYTGGSDANVDLASGDAGAPPVLVIRKKGKEGVFEVGPPNADGQRALEQLHAGEVRGAYGRGHGAVDLFLGDDTHDFTLVRVRGGKDSERIALPVVHAPMRGGVEMIDDSIAWTTRGLATGRGGVAGAGAAEGIAGANGHLWRVDLPASGALPAAQMLGEVPTSDSDGLRGCRHGDTRAILGTPGTGARYVVVKGKHAWGEPQPVDADGFPVLSCRDAGVIITWKTLRRLRCTNAECAADGVTLDLPDQSVATDIGERGVVASGQVLHGGRPGGVHLRVAPVEALHTTPERLLVDDAEGWHDGLEPSELYLFGGADAGLLLVPDIHDNFLYAFRVTPDGTVTPVQRK